MMRRWITAIRRRWGEVYVSAFVLWCVFFCLGIVGQERGRAPLAALAGFWVLSSLAALVSLRWRAVAALATAASAAATGALLLGAALWTSPCDVGRLIERGGRDVALRGIVVSEPLCKGDQWTFFFGVTRLEDPTPISAAQGRVWVRLRNDEGPAYGEELMLAGRLFKPPGFLRINSGAVLSVRKNPGALRSLGTGRRSPVKRWALEVKGYIRRAIAGRVSPACAAVLNAMILGDKAGVPPALREAMIAIGTWHVLVVSGAHTALLAAVFLMALKILRVPRSLRLILAMAFLAFYCVMTGGSPPVVRATVMACVFFAGFLLERPPLFGNALALGGIVILAFDPRALFNAGFQLSFVSVFFIATLSPKLYGSMPDRWRQLPLLSWCGRMGCVSLAAWLGTAPLVAHAFGRFSPWTVAANLVIVPLATLVMTSGLAFIPLAFLIKPLALLMAPAVEALTAVFFRLSVFLSKLPGNGISGASLSSWGVVSYYIFLAVVWTVWSARRRDALPLRPLSPSAATPGFSLGEECRAASGGNPGYAR